MSRVIRASITFDFDIDELENTFGETVLFTCVGDSYSGGLKAGNELFSITGAGITDSEFTYEKG